MPRPKGRAFQSNAYVVCGDLVRIDVSTRRLPNTHAVISATDLTLVVDGNGRWFAANTGRGLYVRRGDKQYLHRLIMPGVALIDHRDGDGLNNARANLRAATKSLNGHNSDGHVKHRRSSFKGVFPFSKKWEARIKVNGVIHRLGTFPTAAEAAEAYNKASISLVGEFSRVAR